MVYSLLKYRVLIWTSRITIITALYIYSGACTKSDINISAMMQSNLFFFILIMVITEMKIIWVFITCTLEGILVHSLNMAWLLWHSILLQSQNYNLFVQSRDNRVSKLDIIILIMEIKIICFNFIYMRVHVRDVGS